MKVVSLSLMYNTGNTFLEKVYGNQTFTYRDEDVAYIWENTYDKKKQSNTYDISFFVRDDEETMYVLMNIIMNMPMGKRHLKL